MRKAWRKAGKVTGKIDKKIGEETRSNVKGRIDLGWGATRDFGTWGGGGGTWVPNGYPWANGRAEWKR